MAIYDKVIVSLLAVATVGVVNNSIQADMIEFPNSYSAPSYVQSESVDVEGHMVETRDMSVEETADMALQTEKTSYAVAPVEERAAAAMATTTVEEEVAEVIQITEVTVTVEEDVEVTEVITTAAPTTTTTTTTTTEVVTVQTTETAPAPTPAPVVINYPSQGTIEYELFILINDARQANGLKPYTYRNDLAGAASVRANEITVLFDHTRPDGSPFYTVNSSIVYGENLATGYSSAREVFDAWMASPSHRANILDSDYEACGFAFLANNDGAANYYWAQEFGYAN